MAKPESRSAFVYFSFLIFVLFCITFLIVVLIISTALQINRVRYDVIQVSEKNETASKIASLVAMYNSFNEIINSHVENYSAIFISINGNISSYGSRFAVQRNLVVEKEQMAKKKFTFELKSLSDETDTSSSTCNSSFVNMDRLVSKLDVAESTWSNFNGQSIASKFYADFYKTVLPSSAILLVNSSLDTSLAFRKTVRVPGGDYLALHDDEAGDYYPAKPVPADFEKIKLKTIEASNGQFFVEAPNSNLSNINITVNISFPSDGQYSTNFDHFVIHALEITD